MAGHIYSGMQQHMRKKGREESQSLMCKRRYLVCIEEKGETELRCKRLCRRQKKEVHFPQLESCAVGIKKPPRFMCNE